MKVRQEVYDTYWKTAAERQTIFFKKLKGLTAPYTDDLIYQSFKFCNVYRASDRVSQFLIKNVIYKRKTTPNDTLFKIFLFRLLNKNETWNLLENKLGEITVSNFNFKRYSRALGEIRLLGPIYGNAFILCANKVFGYDKKHQNHLALLELVFKREMNVNKLLGSKSLKELFQTLRELPLIGDFMAYQLAIDFNYSKVFDFDENDFTIAGPGAERGIRKCFVDIDGRDSEYIIKHMVNNQEKEFQRLGIDFKNLFGRPMHTIDCQGWFCETDKYSRVKFPALKSNRSKIKSKYLPSKQPIELFYPPKWKLSLTSMIDS
ncbi:MAG: nucleotide kinase domain-containing protein [Patescibacteria group bacterium]